MNTNACLACGGELIHLSRREARCKNPDCSGGGRFVPCGFCKEPSFAVRSAAAMRCVNRDCRLFDRTRTVCPSCMKASRVHWKGAEFCLNRHCPENQGVTERCFFCGHLSLFDMGDRYVCTKGGCPRLLDELETCGTCGKRSYVTERERCENPDCREGEDAGAAPGLPRVVLHNSMSLDGRISGFMPDLERHYGVLSEGRFDVHLAGSETLLAQEEELEAGGDEEPPDPPKKDRRPLLAVPDSRGRLRRWDALLRQPYWRGAVALCSEATPSSYLAGLKDQGVEAIVCGAGRVDLEAALRELGARFGARRVLLDGGGGLNGAMARAGLVHEVSLLVHPLMVGTADAVPLLRPPEGGESGGTVRLRLLDVQTPAEDLVWLRYEVGGPGAVRQKP